ncbi:hypothetical protein ACVIGA_005482 [Bradyrhizobium sp. USDA 3240]
MYKRLYGVSREAILRTPAGTSKAQAKALHGQWLAEVETRIERIRAAAKGQGQPLTKLNALALAGRWYAWFLEKHQSGALEQPQGSYIWQVLAPHAPEVSNAIRNCPLCVMKNCLHHRDYDLG